MDPVTIVTAAASLAGAVLKASWKVKETIDAYDDAPQNVADIAEEVHAVQIALRQVESVVLQDPEAIDRLGLEDVFTVAVNGCHATLLSISKEYEDLFLRTDWKTKIKVLWKDGEMTRLLGRLDRKKATLTLLTQTLNLRSTQDIKTLLIQNQSTLNAAKQDVREPAAYYPEVPHFRPASPDSLDEGSVVGVPRNRDSVISTTEFDFDYDLINTKTYRRALQRYASVSARSNSSVEQRTDESPSMTPDLEPVMEEEAEVGDLINFSSDNFSFQTPLSRATTLRPELEGIEFDTPPATPPKDVTRNNALASSEHLEAAGSKKEGGSEPADPSDESKAKRSSSRRKLDRHPPRHLTAAEAAAEKFHRRRRHGKPGASADQEPEVSSTPSTGTLGRSVSFDESLADTMSQSSEKIDKLRSRRRCGHPVHHRRRPGREGSFSSRGSDESTTTLGSVNTLTDTLEHFSLSGPKVFGKEKGRRRQVA
ncbi:hypothetical protein BDP55DRAFT_708721 [Colletotrichum godetiae]|uniref:Azaphilone pigments biosynthesis cluster protein L N-terminal domain-containing protein n=2 Tax=Colletotrichum acutatum species complex TaxID=2707335 RepID=A0AAJ0A6S5_9PEZI|nr:uncharacterized protein BDP55DRAFT_708721 [Colletotrichum godetiae]KAK1657552.1 hypothetical protein BDP55DRAFT_708721 [Colletotrichum godetiae]